jgi:phage/plasmid-associated DNA primase
MAIKYCFVGETGKDKKQKYYSDNLDNLIKKIEENKGNDRFMCEVFTKNTKIKPFLDIDYKINKKGISVNLSKEELAKTTEKILKTIKKSIKCTIDTCKNKNILVMKSHGKDGDRYKISFRIILKGIGYTNITNNKKLAIKIKDCISDKLVKESVDINGAYKTKSQNLRLIFSSKRHQNRPMVPIIKKFKINDYIVSNIIKEKKELHIGNKYLIEDSDNNSQKYKNNKDDSSDGSESFIEKRDMKMKELITKKDLNIPISKEVHDLIDILKKERSDDYMSWQKVGWCLFNIGHIHDICDYMLNIWKIFSLKSKKYKGGECDSLWKKMSFQTNGLSLGSLHKWAKDDNNSKYDELRREWITPLICDSVNGTKGLYNVALVVAMYFKHRWVYTDPIKHEWFYYNDIRRRWEKDYNGIKLHTAISKEISDLYLSVAKKHSLSNNGNNTKKHNRYCDIIEKLLNTYYKNQIVKECYGLMVDTDFPKNFDTNPNLIAFENGYVFDVSTLDFRKMCKDDYVTMSVGYSYNPLRDEDTEQKIHAFFSNVLTDKKKRDCFLTCLSTSLEAYNNNNLLIAMTGIGSNGKSVTSELVSMTLGEYFGVIPSEYFTTQTTKSGGATTEIYNVMKCRWATFREPEKGGTGYNKITFNCEKAKNVTGNTSIPVRNLFKSAEKMVPHFILVGELNEMPHITDKSKGFVRRIKNIVFDSLFIDNPDPESSNQFKMDVDLSKKFINWKMSFFHILTDYFKKYKTEGLTFPACVKYDTKELLREDNIMLEWFDDNIKKKEGGILTLKEAWENFLDYIDKNEYDEKIPKKKDMVKQLNSLTCMRMVNSSTIKRVNYKRFWKNYSL